VNRLWAPWRMPYIGATSTPASTLRACIFCTALASHDDAAALVLTRSAHAFLILNAYPYAPAHLMAVINRHIGALQEARPEEMADAMRLVGIATGALTEEYRAEGFNIGLNQGRVAGAGIEGHLHVHVVPRWNGDHNFVTVLGETRVLPETLAATYARLHPRLAGK
jgi:ATP adenylyltransferase